MLVSDLTVGLDCLMFKTLFRAREIGCNNAETPDMFGHYRQAKFTMIKHHWWWKVSIQCSCTCTRLAAVTSSSSSCSNMEKVSLLAVLVLIVTNLLLLRKFSSAVSLSLLSAVFL